MAGAAITCVLGDDHEALRRGLVALLRDDPGLSVTGQAANGQELLEMALRRRPDILIVDRRMPGLDGIELCRRLRADARTRNIPVLAITGYGDRAYPDRARIAGADQVLIKPCDAQVLICEARRLLTHNGDRESNNRVIG